MFRRFSAFVFLVFAATVALQNGANAQTEQQLAPADAILTTLLSRGYVIVENDRTWLGRQRILAEKDGTQREVVFVPGTGEILRDYSAAAAPIVTPLPKKDGGSRGADIATFDADTGDGGGVAAAPTVGAEAAPHFGGVGMAAPTDTGLLP